MSLIDEGAPKLWLTKKTLDVRKALPSSFGPDSFYAPIYAQGAKARNVVAYARGADVAVVAPRLLMSLEDGWADTALELPGGWWVDRFTGERYDGSVRLGRLSDVFPVALLVREGAAG